MGAVVGFLVATIGLAAGVTILFLGMRAVMDVGGMCATGGPYVPAVECPEGVPAAMTLGVFASLVATLAMVLFGTRLGGRYAVAWLLVWPALFLTTGWNFLEYGLDPPGEAGLDWGWLVCAVVFLLLGGVPLILAVLWRDDLSSTAVRYRLQGGGRSRARGGEPTEAHMVLQVPGMDDIDLGPAPEMGPRVDLGPAIHLAPAPDAGPAAAAPGLVDELERLAGLRDRGALTADEYAAAKRALIGGAER